MVVMVNAEFPLVLNEVGLKVALAPEGNPVKPKATLPLKLLLVAMLIIKPELPPGATLLAGSRLVDCQAPSAVILVVQSSDCLLCLGIGVHLDKAEAFAASCVTVGDDLSTLDGTELRKELL